MKHSTEFQALQAEWDKKLEESGFDDKEQRDGRLKSWSLKYKNSDPSMCQAKQEYYRAAGHFLHEYEFEYPVERRIWELHSQGVSRPPIVQILRDEGLWFDKQRQGGRKMQHKKRKDSRPNSFGVQQVIESIREKMFKKIEDERNARQDNEE